MATPTYIPITSQTLASATATVTISGFPTDTTYKDLVLIGQFRSSSGNPIYGLRFNGNTNNYRYTFFGSGSGGAASNANNYTFNYARLGLMEILSTTEWSYFRCEIFGYRDSSHKQLISKTGRAAGADNGQCLISNTWEDTTVISSIDIITTSGGFASGSKFELYGIVG